MLRLELFHRDFEIRKFADLGTERHFAQQTLRLPRGSTFHYLPETEQDWGISVDDFVLQDVDQNIYVEHVSEYKGTPIGRPRSVPFREDREIKDYHRKHRILRRSKNRMSSIRDDRTLLIVNYASVQHHYRYTRTYQSTYQKWYNLLQTSVEGIIDHLKTTPRDQFIRLQVPEKLPTLTALKKIEQGGLSSDALEAFPYPESLNVLDVWRMLDPESTESVFDRIPKDQWNRVHLLWCYGTRWFSIPLGTLKGFTYETEVDAKERDVNTVRKRFLKLLMRLQEVGRGELSNPEESLQAPKTEKGEEVIDEDEDESDIDRERDLEILEEVDSGADESDPIIGPATNASAIRKEPAPEPANTLEKRAVGLAEAGRLTGGELRRAQKLATAYQKIKHPVSGEPLEEYRQIPPEMYDVTPEELMEADAAVPDDSMRRSTINVMRKQYVEEVLPRDVVNVLLSAQNVGGAITDYNVEKIEDAAGGFEAHTVRIQPLQGAPSTLRFKLPIVREDGSFVANGVKNYMRWQRGDLPIRKTGPGTVALTSYYGKVFAVRSEKVAYDYGTWLTRTLIGIGLDQDDSRIKTIRLGNVFNHERTESRIIAELSKKISRLEFKGYVLNLDRGKLLKGSEDEIAKIEKGKWSVVGKYQGQYLTVRTNDPLSTLYTYDGKNHNEAGTIEDLLDLDLSKAPVDTAELNIFSKTIPLGLVLGYLVGFKGLYRALGVEPRIVPSGERLQLEAHEFVIRFSNESYVFSREDSEAALLLNGFNQQKRLIQRYSTREFEKKDVYKNILEEMGLGVRYAREIELMDEMFVDPITLDILKSRNEPETFRGLLLYATELLLTNWYPKENDMGYQRIRGYERMAGAVYQELVRSARGYRMNPNPKKAKFEMNPEAVWLGILQDPSVGLVKENNPISALKENEDVTFTGVGGRSVRSMVERTRHYHHSDLGVISEATVDSSKVGVTTYLSQNPNFENIRGVTRRLEKDDGPANIFSTTFLLSPASDKDDQSRSAHAVTHV